MEQTTSKAESVEFIQGLHKQRGFPPPTENDLQDWNLQGGETFEQLREWAFDHMSDIQSDRAEDKVMRERGDFDHLDDYNDAFM